MELQPATVATLDSYWQTFFGDAVTNVDTPQTLVVPHAEVGAYHGIFLFRRRHTLMISVPPALVDSHHMQLATMTVADFEDPATLMARVDAPIARLVGPAFIGYTDASTFQPCHTSAVCLLTACDEAAFHIFRTMCPARSGNMGAVPSARGHWLVIFVRTRSPPLPATNSGGRALPISRS